MANSKNGNYGGDSREVLSCSFCGKSEYEVPRLFSGVNCYICIDCIRTAYGIVAEEEKVNKKRKMRSIKPKKLVTPHEIKEKLDSYVIGQDDAAAADWWPLSALPQLAFDHDEIMAEAIALYNRMY